MPDPLTGITIVLASIGAGAICWGLCNGVTRLYYKVRYKVDTLRMQREQLQYATEQALRNAYQARLQELEEHKQSLLDEVHRLTRRNMMMARELRSDSDQPLHKMAPTEVLPPPTSGRFAKWL